MGTLYPCDSVSLIFCCILYFRVHIVTIGKQSDRLNAQLSICIYPPTTIDEGAVPHSLCYRQMQSCAARVCNSAFARQKCATRHLIGTIARKTLFVLLGN